MGKWYANWRAWQSDRRLIVIESDDWGTIRMPNKAALDRLATTNPEVLNDPFCRFDTLARQEDLERLFNVLQSVKDQKGSYPVLTANTIVANPIFKEIKDSDFRHYSYEPFAKTITNYYDQQVLNTWQEGLKNGVFKPQLHGREHVHVPLWLKSLQAGDQQLAAAFAEGCFGVPLSDTGLNRRRNLMSALDEYDLPDEAAFQAQAIQEGAQLFEDYFGYRSTSFIAPAYIWSARSEQVLQGVGVRLLQGLPLQYAPSSRGYQKKLRYVGQRNKLGQQYNVRNVFFEPALKPDHDWATEVLAKIEVAFQGKRPAVIGTHRINFIGAIDQKNADQNLSTLSSLLKSIVKKWPDVEFISTADLADMLIAVNTTTDG